MAGFDTMGLESDSIATVVSCSISIVASLILIIWEVVEYRRLITTAIERPIALNLSNCIIMLGAADIVASTATMLSLLNHIPGICFLQAQLTEIGVLSTILWTGLYCI